MASGKDQKDIDNDEKPVKKREVLAYKYSAKGTSSLYEAIIMQGSPCFVTFNLAKKEPRSVTNIEE